ncbi:MAG: hypothetical protein ABI790_11665 [Betaproteobacteria bacterium]
MDEDVDRRIRFRRDVDVQPLEIADGPYAKRRGGPSRARTLSLLVA